MAFSILSFDGGGTWALIQARVLEERYGAEKKGHEILREYDLVIANSGGSLVMAMLCANKSVSEIRKTFENTDVLKAIFKKKFLSRIKKWSVFPNYDTENKYEVFREHLQNEFDGVSDEDLNKMGVKRINKKVPFGDVLLPYLPKLIGKPELQIIITNFDYDRERAVYWRSNTNSKMESSYIEEQTGNPRTDIFKTVTLAGAIHGSSNAPIQFFDDPATVEVSEFQNENKKSTKRLYWDGAVGGNNNPVKAGVLEALANSDNREKMRKEIRVVSIGTSNTIQPVLYGHAGECQPQYGWLVRYSKIDDVFEDLERMANSIIADPPDASAFDAHQVLDLPYKSEDQRFIRINPLVKPILKKDSGSRDGWCMPGGEKWTPETMEDLFTLDMAVSTEEGVKLINLLCDDYFKGLFHNQGIRIGGRDMSAILGHKLFQPAMDHWKSWPNWK
ncbi:MAG: hypothetical protein K0S32_1821 [Bacteroidetes bacterium]|jgi:patatin-like phospholipase/acyl hydrolase|nr:hypothetical protein [Bacteroidota bacterium]